MILRSVAFCGTWGEILERLVASHDLGPVSYFIFFRNFFYQNGYSVFQEMRVCSSTCKFCSLVQIFTSNSVRLTGSTHLNIDKLDFNLFSYSFEYL